MQHVKQGLTKSQQLLSINQAHEAPDMHLLLYKIKQTVRVGLLTIWLDFVEINQRHLIFRALKRP